MNKIKFLDEVKLVSNRFEMSPRHWPAYKAVGQDHIYVVTWLPLNPYAECLVEVRRIMKNGKKHSYLYEVRYGDLKTLEELEFLSVPLEHFL